VNITLANLQKQLGGGPKPPPKLPTAFKAGGGEHLCRQGGTKIKRTISILNAERERYFVHGFSLGLKAFCQLQGLSLRLVDREGIQENGVDIFF